MLKKAYSYGAYNKCNEKEQWIRITEGCPNKCYYCYEPEEYKIFGIPEIVRNKVKIMDMNLLCKPEAIDIINKLGRKRVNNKVVYYELICGIDYRFLNKNIAIALKINRFKNIRLSWDRWMAGQYEIKKSIQLLIKAGYNSKSIMVFIICNFLIKYKTNCQKLDLLKIWKVKVCDCYFDGQIKKIEPVYWDIEEIKSFRKKCRKHNQLVNFEIDPEIKNNEDQFDLELDYRKQKAFFRANK